MTKIFLTYLFALLSFLTIVRDFFYFKIDNGLCLGFAFLGICYTLEGFSGTSLTTAFTSSFIILTVGFLLYLLSFIGAGDVKLLAVLAFWVAPQDYGEFFVRMTLLGVGICGMEVCFWQKLRYCRHHVTKKIKKIIEKYKILNKFLLCLTDINKYPAHLKNVWARPIPYGIAIVGAGLWQIL